MHKLVHSLSLPIQERISKTAEFAKWLFGIHHKSVSWSTPISISIHDSDKRICSWFRANSHPWKILLQEVPNRDAKYNKMILKTNWEQSIKVYSSKEKLGYK